MQPSEPDGRPALAGGRVVDLNGGWTADPKREKHGRDLGYTAYHRMAEALGCHGEYVEEPEGSARPPSALLPPASRRRSTC